ncbi:SDR family NAD(P)-dependent oxidoreductase [Luteibacter sp. NPDC031894]|uniref:SDR family NAD(P)-dependent oxidoreductase n=1 Tax=Luteibacter sp. NPDC031894 TaxID=3390572 RepID=UPI003D08F933
MGIRRVGVFAGLAAAIAAALLLTGCATGTRIASSDAKRLHGSTFVITGASSGFGRGVALAVAANGGNVVLVARRAHVLEAVAAEARAAGGAAEVVPADVADAAAMDEVAAPRWRGSGASMCGSTTPAWVPSGPSNEFRPSTMGAWWIPT